MNDRYELLGFGAKIARRHNFAQVEQVRLTEPIQRSEAVLVHPDALNFLCKVVKLKPGVKRRPVGFHAAGAKS